MVYKSYLITFILLISLSSFVNAATIDSVDWDKYLTKSFEERYVLAKTSGYSDGTSVIIEIWEDDFLDDDFIANFSGGVKNNRIIAKWGGANGEDGFNNAEYYAKVKIGNVQRNSWNMDFKASGNLEHNEGDCNLDSSCQNKLYCEGIPIFSAGGGGSLGDGCCFDYENWNVNQNFCNYAIKGQVFNVVTNQQNTFSSQPYSNISLFFVVYDDSSLLGRITNPVFADYVQSDSNGNFKYNPEFNRQTEWNSNILFDWNIKVFALDNNNNPIASWTNSYTNDNDKYKKGLDYIDQRVRIHTDKPYWKQTSDSFEINNLTSSENIQNENIKDDEEIHLTEEQNSQLNLIKNKIVPLLTESETDDLTKTFSASSTDPEEQDVEKEEEILYNSWKGILMIGNENSYYFNATILGGYKIILDEEMVIDSLYSDEVVSFPSHLTEGEHNITIEYVHLIERESPNLMWKRGSEESFYLVPSSNLIKESFNYQYYKINSSLEIKPFEKFKEEKELNELLETTNSINTNAFSVASISSSFYQVSFLEAPRKNLNVNNEPLILVHGLNGESGYFDGHFEDKLIAKGYDVWKFYYPNDQKIDYSGTLLSDGISYVNSFYTSSKVKIVSHSMGGLVTRSYIEGIATDPNGKNISYHDDVSKLLMLAPPNYGSYLANRIIYDEGMNLACQVINEVGGWLLFGKPFISWNQDAPAYTDLAIGSDFIWKLNIKNTTSNVDTLIIAGKNQDIPCLPFEADDSDDLVSVSSASRINNNLPLIVINRNHKTIYTQIELWEHGFWDMILDHYTGQAWSSVLRPLIEDYLNTTTNLDNVIGLIDQFMTNQNNFGSYLNHDEVYINSNNANNPFGEGTALIKVNETFNGQVKIVNSSIEYQFTQNPTSKIFYHFNYDDNKEDYGLTIPEGNYSLFVNGQDTNRKVEIKAAETSLYEINLCTPNWVLNNTWSECSSNDQQFKNYFDINSCNDNKNKPLNIIGKCDFCKPNFTCGGYNKCSANDTQSCNLVNDTFSCYNKTGLESDLYLGNFSEFEPLICDFCTPKWIESFTPCQKDEIFKNYFIDNNSCYNKTGLNSDLLGRPQNNTYSCDFDNDGFIGNITEIKNNLDNINLGKIKDKLILKENNKTRIELPNITINIKNLTIKKQENNSSFGSLLIRGLDLNGSNKTVYVDIISNTSKLCLKDQEITNLTEISNSCIKEDELLVLCPGSNFTYSCEIVNNSYKISGLKHSGIKEQESCDESWTCSEWSSCTSGTQTRTCTDSNLCGTTNNKPQESQSCSTGVDTGSPGGSSGGGGGGGGGGSSSSRSVTPTPQPTPTFDFPIPDGEEPQEAVPETLQEEPKEEPVLEAQEQTTQGFFAKVWNGIKAFFTNPGPPTGAAIGVLSGNNGVWSTIISWVVLILTLTFLTRTRIVRKLRFRIKRLFKKKE
nr:hypothetical protein [Candidatus Woesearchaeota archaeon]